MTTSASNQGARYEALLQLLRTADTLWNASRAFFDQWNLSPSQFNVLSLLRSQPGGLSQTELSRELIMHRSNATGLVDRLEKRGLVQRQEVTGDRRAYRVVLTLAGTDLLQSILPKYYQRADEVWGDLGQAQVRRLVAELRTVAENAERIGKEVVP